MSIRWGHVGKIKKGVFNAISAFEGKKQLGTLKYNKDNATKTLLKTLKNC